MSEGINIQNDEEIQKALKEFEVKTRADEDRKIAQDLKPEKTSRIADLVIKYSHGYIKEKRQAEYVLLVFVFLAGALSMFLFMNTSDTSVTPAQYRGNIPDLPEYRNPKTPQELQQL